MFEQAIIREPIQKFPNPKVRRLLLRAEDVIERWAPRIRSKSETARVTLATGALFMTTACGISEVSDQPIMPTVTVAGEQKPIPPDYEFRTVGTMTVVIDRIGLPVKYILSDKSEVMLDRNEMQKIRNRALSSQEPEIAKIIESADRGTLKEPQHQPTTEHPSIKDLPNGVLPEIELEKKGVKIIQSNNTKLFVREGAFAENGPLAAFDNTGRKLTIVLVDGPLLTGNFLKDSKYDEVRNIIIDPPRRFGTIVGPANFIDSHQIEEYRRNKISQLEDTLQQLRQETMDRESRVDSMLSIKTWLYRYKNLLTEDQLVTEMVVNKYTDAAGKYAVGSSTEPAVVFVSVGSGRQTGEGVQISFDDQGIVDITSYAFVHSSFELTPKAEQTHPNPDNFRLNPDASPDKPRSYPYTGQSPGFILLHELAHDDLMIGNFLRQQRLNLSEYDTDMKAMQWIRNAWEKWKNSGYKDDSGYSFVFSLPQGGYILN